MYGYCTVIFLLTILTFLKFRLNQCNDNVWIFKCEKKKISRIVVNDYTCVLIFLMSQWSFFLKKSKGLIVLYFGVYMYYHLPPNFSFFTSLKHCAIDIVKCIWINFLNGCKMNFACYCYESLDYETIAHKMQRCRLYATTRWFQQSMGDMNRVGTELSYRPASLCSMVQKLRLFNVKAQYL
jgi:hypothetical protein